MKKTLSFLLAAVMLISVFLCGCGEEKKPPKKDSTGEYCLAMTPSEADKKEIDEVLESFLKCYEEGRAEDACSLFNKDFTGETEEIASFFEEIKKVCKAPFAPFDGYYVSGLEVSDLPIKVKHTEEDTNYVELIPASDELYCGLFVSEGEKTSYIFSLLLAKENGDWKLAWVNVGDLSYNGKTAPELYAKTTELEGSGKLLSAYIYSCLLANTFRPGEYMRYEADTEMEDICYRLYAEVTDKFKAPVVLENTSGSEVFAIRIINDEVEGMIPLFLVKTDVPISDRDALVSEAGKVIDALELLSPGLRENFTHASFSMTNDDIDENNPAPKSSESFVIGLN